MDAMGAARSSSRCGLDKFGPLVVAYRTQEIDDYRIREAPGGLFLDKPFTVVALERTVRATLDYHKRVRWPRRQ